MNRAAVKLIYVYRGWLWSAAVGLTLTGIVLFVLIARLTDRSHHSQTHRLTYSRYNPPLPFYCSPVPLTSLLLPETPSLILTRRNAVSHQHWFQRHPAARLPIRHSPVMSPPIPTPT